MGSSSRMKRHHDQQLANEAARAKATAPKVKTIQEAVEIAAAGAPLVYVNLAKCDHTYIEQDDLIVCRNCGDEMEEECL